MDKTRDKVFRRKDSFTRIPKVYENGRKELPRPRSRSVFTSSHASDDLQTRDIVRYEGQNSRPPFVPKPITVKNYFSEDYTDVYNEDGYSGGTTISPHGIITMRLREFIRVDLSLDRAVRISNAKNGIVLALSASGSSSGLIHPNGRVYQYGSRVEIMANDGQGNDKFAKMWYKGVSFTSIQCALVYLVDSAGTRTTTDTFNDLTHDFTLNIFYEDSPYSYLDNPSTTHTTHLVNEAMSILQATNCWMTEDGTTNWIINNVRISQTSDGLVRVGRNSNKFSLRTSPTNGSASVSSPYMHCTGSMGQTRHLFVRRGERRMHYDGSTFIVRNAGHSAGFDEKHQLKMKKKTVLAISMAVTVIIVALVIGIVSAQSDDGRRLEMVHIVMRHGIRTPASTYPNDPFINNTFYPTGWGQITNAGKLQLYQIGKFLRARYNEFLGAHYSPDEYYVQCTGVDRTKVSLQTVNAGLWPPDESQKWGPLDWQPIPINSEPLDDDSLLLVRRPCANYHIERQKVLNSPEVQGLFQKYDSLFKELTEITGQKTEDFDGVQDIYSTLLAEEGLNLTLPAWTKNYFPEKMYEPTVLSFIINAYNDQMNRLKGGVFVKKLLSDWTSKADGTIKPSSRKAFLYGGHDATIVNILRALKIWDKQFPTYAITILFEFSKDLCTGNYGLEVYLRNSTSLPPFKLTIPGCDSFCPLDKLTDLTKNVIPEDWEEECKTDDKGFVVPTPGGP